MDSGRPVLIAAASGRALAASAQRGGYVPLVADAFGDRDTLAAAAAHVQADLLARPIDGDELCAALSRLANGYEPVGLVWGSGFEDRGDLLDRIAARWRLIGNDAATVARVKDPLRLAALCRAANIPHPETSLTAPNDRRCAGAQCRCERNECTQHCANRTLAYDHHQSSAVTLAPWRSISATTSRAGMFLLQLGKNVAAAPDALTI